MIARACVYGFVSFYVLVAAQSVWAQEQAVGRLDRRTMQAFQMNDGESITLDGRLDEPVWQRAVPATDFVQQDPVNGGTPTERTEVRIVIDRERLYMGVTCFDSEPDRLLGNTMKRDTGLGADDRFMWVIDTFLNARNGYFFEMNPSGLMADALMTEAGQTGRQWDGIWDARVRRSEIGWTIEVEIPFRTLNFNPDVSVWGINFQRTIRRKNEENLWTGYAYNQGLWRMANTGQVTGISGVSQGHGLDIKPYVAGSAESSPGRGDAAITGIAGAGVDVVYSLTPGLRANFTLNTDFAQTEVDQRLVNLTRFPLFLPEKRDFFLEGATFLDFGSEVRRRTGFRRQPPDRVTPFFSRRIGLDETGRPQKVEFGTKLIGQVGAQDVGMLHVRTGHEGAIVGEDFTLLRVRRRLLTQSYVGALYTGRSARRGDAPGLHTAGFDFRLATSTFRGSENLELNGFYLHTTNPADTGESAAFGVSLDYPNDRWDWALAFREIEENYDPAIGFAPRVGFRRLHPRIQFSPRPRGHAWIRRLAFGAVADLRTDMRNEWLTRELDINVFRIETQAQDIFAMHVTSNYERLEEDFTIHPGVVLPAGAEHEFLRYRAQLRTASRRILAVESRVEMGEFFSGNRQEVALTLAIRPRVGVVVNLENEWNRVSLPEGRFETRLFRVIADTQFSPWLYFVNNIQFDSVSRVLGWQFRTRWILTPGNDLYAVYLHNWQEDSLTSLDRDRFRTLDRRGATKFVYTYRF